MSQKETERRVALKYKNRSAFERVGQIRNDLPGAHLNLPLVCVFLVRCTVRWGPFSKSPPG